MSTKPSNAESFGENVKSTNNAIDRQAVKELLKQLFRIQNIQEKFVREHAHNLEEALEMVILDDARRETLNLQLLVSKIEALNRQQFPSLSYIAEKLGINVDDFYELMLTVYEDEEASDTPNKT